MPTPAQARPASPGAAAPASAAARGVNASTAAAGAAGDDVLPGEPVVSDRARARLSGLLWIVVGVLLLVGYPLALLPARYVNLPYHLQLPVAVLATLAAIPVLVAHRRTPRGWPAVACTLYLAGLGLSTALHPDFPWAAMELLGYLLVPLALGVTIRQGLAPSRRTLTRWALLLFALHVYLAAFKIGPLGGILDGLLERVASIKLDAAERSLTGLSGNQNWVGATLVCLLPWLVAGAHDWLGRFSWLAGTRTAGALLLAGGPVVALLVACESRGAWVALVGMIAVYGLWHVRPWWMRAGVAACGLLVGLIAFFLVAGFATDRLVRAVSDDVRLPMWGSTIGLVLDHDWTGRAIGKVIGRTPEAIPAMAYPTGVGPGNFQTAYAPYRAQSRYVYRRVAAATTIHPHNEFLNIAAQIGILAALAWLALVARLLAPPTDPLARLGALGALACLIAGAFDMPLVQQPVNLLSWVCLGFAWQDLLRPQPAWLAGASIATVRKGLVSLTVMVLLIGGGGRALSTLRVSAHVRQAFIMQHFARFEEADTAWRKALSIWPDDLGLRYLRASNALLNLPEDVDLIGDFEYVYDIDPNYIHINAMLGSYYFNHQRYPESYVHYVRESQLYPAAPESWTRLYGVSILLGSLDSATGAEWSLQRLALRLQERYTADQVAARRALAQQWLVAVRAQDQATAIEIAKTLTADLEMNYQDPMFYALSGDYAWPSAYLKASYQDDDFAWWRQCLVLRDYATSMPGASKSAQLASAYRSVFASGTVRPSLPGMQSPLQVLRTHAGSPESCAALADQIAMQLDFLSVIEVDADGRPTGIASLNEADVVTWQFDGDDARIESRADWQQAHVGSDYRFRIYRPFSMHQLRNQLLGVILNFYLAPLPTDAAPPPTTAPTLTCALPINFPTNLTVRTWALLRGTKPTFADLHTITAKFEFETVLAGLQAPPTRPQPSPYAMPPAMDGPFPVPSPSPSPAPGTTLAPGETQDLPTVGLPANP